MQGFIENIIAEVDAMEKQIALEETNLFESYELDNVEVIFDDEDIDINLDEDDDFDVDLEEDDDDLDSVMLDEDDLDLSDIDEDCCNSLDEDELDIDDLDEGFFSKESKLKRLTNKANKANNSYLKASAKKNKADLKLSKFKMKNNM